MQKIHTVDSVSLFVLDSAPRQLLVCASGHAVSSGWSEPRLLEHSLARAPEGGIVQFDFVAEPPRGMALPALFPISVQHVFSGDLEAVKGVRVNASSAHVQQALRVGAERHKPAEGAGELRSLAGEARFPYAIPASAYQRPDQSAGEDEVKPGVLLGGALRQEPAIKGEGTGLVLEEVLVEVDPSDIPQWEDYVNMLCVVEGDFELMNYPRRGKVWTFVAKAIRPHKEAD